MSGSYNPYDQISQLSDDDLTEIGTGNTFLHFGGFIEYDDIFGRPPLHSLAIPLEAR
jgi:hypothetical protein